MNPVVKTRHGKVRGSAADGVNTFKGIRYAAAPFGAYRLQPQRLVARGRGARPPLARGRRAPVLPSPPPIDALIPEFAVPGADCLNLNIWSPDLGAAGRPVMVWIPGGVFEFGTGAAPAYD